MNAPANAPAPAPAEPTNALSTHVAQPPSQMAAGWLTPTNLESGMRLAELMAKAKLVPQHLQGSVSDCLLVISQAARWGMDPFAVAQATAVVRGKLCLEGKLVAAALVATGAVAGGLDYEFEGEGQNMAVTISGVLSRSGKTKTLKGTVKGWRTENGQWDKDPQAMLAYRGARQWARLYAPETILGVVTPDEAAEPREAEGVRVVDAVPEAKAPKARGKKETAEAAAPAEAPAADQVAPVEKPGPDPRVAVLVTEAGLVHASGAAGQAEMRAIANQLGVTKLQNVPVARLDEALALVRKGAALLNVALPAAVAGGAG